MDETAQPITFYENNTCNYCEDFLNSFSMQNGVDFVARDDFIEKVKSLERVKNMIVLLGSVEE